MKVFLTTILIYWGWCELSWDRRGASFSVGREHGNSLWQQDRVRPVRRVLIPALPTQPENVHCCRQRLGAEMWGLESRPKQRTAVGCEEKS